MSSSKADVEVETKYIPGAAHVVKPLVTRLSIRNFMCFKSLDLKSLNQNSVPYEGGEGDGKSAFIIAVLVGLGYDILLDTEDIRTLCGFQIANVVRHGESQSQLDITLSLHSSNQLKTIFGPFLTITRVIHRDRPLKTSQIEIAPSDSSGDSFQPRRLVTAQELRLTLQMIGITSNLHRLIVLDETNLLHLLQHPCEWYQLYEDAFLATKRKVLKEFIAMELHIEKLERDVRWRALVENHLDAELQNPYLVDSMMLIHDRNNDVKAMSKIQESMRGLRSEIDTCRNMNGMHQKELEELHINFYYSMSKVYRKFLNCQNLTGDLLIDPEAKQIGIWITTPKELTPRSIPEALLFWEKLPVSRKRIATMGLYFALWEVNETCPIFLTDSYSATSTEFKLPDQVLPLLKELVEQKSKNPRTNHQQMFYTVQGSPQIPLVGNQTT